MPEEEYVWLPRDSLLSFEEIVRLVGVFTSLGVSKVRITGGEPLLRHDLPALIALLRRNRSVRDLALTTNGMLLARHAEALHDAGLERVTVSLDTLRADRFERFARSAQHADVLAGIEAARAAGFRAIKINTVLTRGFNDDEVLDLLEFARSEGLEVRFIEYMDVGGATRWSMEDVVTRAEMLELVRAGHGRVEPAGDASGSPAPADRFRLPDGTVFGIISSTTAPFCHSCDRSRITADGMWFLCLYAGEGVDLKDGLRSGVSDEELAGLIAGVWRERRDRGAEERLDVSQRGPLYELDGLRADPHREMHTRGG
jgi:cyclic pyranopterin phosphate synthase